MYAGKDMDQICSILYCPVQAPMVTRSTSTKGGAWMVPLSPCELNQCTYFQYTTYAKKIRMMGGYTEDLTKLSILRGGPSFAQDRDNTVGANVPCTRAQDRWELLFFCCLFVPGIKTIGAMHGPYVADLRCQCSDCFRWFITGQWWDFLVHSV